MKHDWIEKARLAENMLKPCPLCALSARILLWEHGWSVSCSQCLIKINIHSDYLSQAVVSWNCRDGKVDLALDESDLKKLDCAYPRK